MAKIYYCYDRWWQGNKGDIWFGQANNVQSWSIVLPSPVCSLTKWPAFPIVSFFLCIPIILHILLIRWDQSVEFSCITTVIFISLVTWHMIYGSDWLLRNEGRSESRKKFGFPGNILLKIWYMILFHVMLRFCITVLLVVQSRVHLFGGPGVA